MAESEMERKGPGITIISNRPWPRPYNDTKQAMAPALQ